MELMSAGAEGVGYLLKDRVGDLVVFTDRGAPGRRARVGSGSPQGSAADGQRAADREPDR
jgi:hypothetical protein